MNQHARTRRAGLCHRTRLDRQAPTICIVPEKYAHKPEIACKAGPKAVAAMPVERPIARGQCPPRLSQHNNHLLWRARSADLPHRQGEGFAGPWPTDLRVLRAVADGPIFLQVMTRE